MRVHRGTILDLHEGTVYVWADSKRECRKRARRALDDMRRKAETLDEAVTFDRPDVDADWLHAHFRRDNG